MASSDSCGPKVLKEILSCGITWKLTGKLTMGAMAFSQADNLRADNQVPGTIRYLARSGTWHDLVPGTTWQMFVVLGSLALLATPHQRGGREGMAWVDARWVLGDWGLLLGLLSCVCLGLSLSRKKLTGHRF